MTNHQIKAKHDFQMQTPKKFKKNIIIKKNITTFYNPIPLYIKHEKNKPHKKQIP